MEELPKSPRNVRHAPLTAQLKFSQSPLSRFLGEHLPATKELRDDYQERLSGTETIRPLAQQGYDWVTAAHAIEYRLLMGIGYQPCFEPLPGRPELPGLVRPAALGVGVALHQFRRTHDKEWQNIIGLGIGLTETLSRRDWGIPLKLSGPEERRIRALCAQSWYETLYRSGSVPPQLLGVRDDQELLDRVPDQAVQDVWNMAAKAWPAWQEFRYFTPVHYNPVMPESLGIPADGDVVIDGLLVDVKATVNPHRFSRQEFWQLAGYLLMDVDDKYGITGCGLYMARQGVMIRWGLDTFLKTLSGGRYGEGDLADLRRKLAEFLAECDT